MTKTLRRLRGKEDLGIAGSNTGHYTGLREKISEEQMSIHCGFSKISNLRLMAAQRKKDNLMSFKEGLEI